LLEILEFEFLSLFFARSELKIINCY